MKVSKECRSLTPIIITLTALLLAVGVVILYSIVSAKVDGNKLIIKQLIYIAAGSCAIIALYHIDYRYFKKYIKAFLIIITLGLLYLVLAKKMGGLPFARSVKGAYRWIDLKVFSIQVSEFAKLAIIFYLANYFETNQFRINQTLKSSLNPFRKDACRSFYYSMLKPGFVSGIIIALILAGKNLSITVISSTIFLVMYYVSGAKTRWLILVLTIGLSALAADYYLLPVEKRVVFVKYRMERLASFRNPEKYKQDEGRQLWYGMIALGSGGATGVGFTDSRMKRAYIPEVHTDFGLTILGEEFGFIALVTVLGLYVAITWFGYLVAARAPDYMGAYLAFGVTSSFLFHALVNFSVICGLFPTTGVTIPFISYGGSSIVANMICVGVLLSVDNATRKRGKDYEIID